MAPAPSRAPNSIDEYGRGLIKPIANSDGLFCECETDIVGNGKPQVAAARLHSHPPSRIDSRKFSAMRRGAFAHRIVTGPRLAGRIAFGAIALTTISQQGTTAPNQMP
jgi:hypothetical protein